MKPQFIAAIALSIAVLLPGSGWAGEIILVDPLSGAATSTRGAGSRDPVMDSMTGVDRARDRIAPKGSQSEGNLIIIQPYDRPGPPGSTGNPAVDARRAARDSRDRAGNYGGGDEDGPGGLDSNAIVIIENGQARTLQQGERVDAATRMMIDNAKAKSYQRGGAPCGSVVVGGVGDGAAPSATSQAKDVYVLNNNCR